MSELGRHKRPPPVDDDGFVSLEGLMIPETKQQKTSHQCRNLQLGRRLTTDQFQIVTPVL